MLHTVTQQGPLTRIIGSSEASLVRASSDLDWSSTSLISPARPTVRDTSPDGVTRQLKFLILALQRQGNREISERLAPPGLDAFTGTGSGSCGRARSTKDRAGGQSAGVRIRQPLTITQDRG